MVKKRGKINLPPSRLIKILCYEFSLADSVIAILYTTKPKPILLIASAMLYHRSTSEGDITPLNQPPGMHM